MHKPFEIVFQDDTLIIVNKIARILVEPADDNSGGATLTSLLSKKIGLPVWPCHRLDRETTGLMIYVKTSEAQTKIMDQFRQALVKKEYLAFVRGKFGAKVGVFAGKVLDTEGRKKGELAKDARTAYQVVGSYGEGPGIWSEVSLKPFTGRTNQLRIQLAQSGHPILGERKYAYGRDFKIRFRRLALHASYISFKHPVSEQIVEFKLELAKDMADFKVISK